MRRRSLFHAPIKMLWYLGPNEVQTELTYVWHQLQYDSKCVPNVHFLVCANNCHPKRAMRTESSSGDALLWCTLCCSTLPGWTDFIQALGSRKPVRQGQCKSQDERSRTAVRNALRAAVGWPVNHRLFIFLCRFGNVENAWMWAVLSCTCTTTRPVPESPAAECCNPSSFQLQPGNLGGQMCS
jgi:hypothetical protein